MLFAVQRPDRRDFAVLDRKTGRYTVIVNGADSGDYVSSGHIIYLSGADLLAVPFNLGTLSIAGEPAVVAENVRTKPNGAADFAVSRNGTLAYSPASPGVGSEELPEVVWVNRDGREESTGLPARNYSVPRLSPDATRAVIDIRGSLSQLWTWDITRGSLTLLAGGSRDDNPLWTPDGRSVIFRSARTGTVDLFRMAGDGTGMADRLTDGPVSPLPKAVSPDGKLLVVMETVPVTGQDLNLLAIGQRQSTPLINVRGVQNNPDFAPNGRWIVYESRESGASEVFVRPFPNVNDGQWQVSTAGGNQPAWARDGRELFFVDAEGYLMVSSVDTSGRTFSAARPTRAFPVAHFTGGANGPRNYDLSPDGRRILMVKDRTSARSTEQAKTIVVVERATSGLGPAGTRP